MHVWIRFISFSRLHFFILFFALLGFSNSEKTCDKEFIIRRAATNRVLNVLRHWVSKHSQVSQRRALLHERNQLSCQHSDKKKKWKDLGFSLRFINCIRFTTFCSESYQKRGNIVSPSVGLKRFIGCWGVNG